MKTMLRIFALFIALSLLLTMAACGAPGRTPADPPEPTPEVTPEPTPEPTPEVTPEPTPEPTPEVTPEPTPESTPEVTPEPTPKPTEPAAPAFSLVGAWTGVRRDGTELNTRYFVFEEDGTGYNGGCCYCNISDHPFPDADPDEGGWYEAPMGYPFDYFTYKLENGVLSITYIGGDVGDYDPYTDTHTLRILGDDLISLDDRYGKYTREDLSLKDLCARLGVDYSAPKSTTVPTDSEPNSPALEPLSKGAALGLIWIYDDYCIYGACTIGPMVDRDEQLKVLLAAGYPEEMMDVVIMYQVTEWETAAEARAHAEYYVNPQILSDNKYENGGSIIEYNGGLYSVVGAMGFGSYYLTDNPTPVDDVTYMATVYHDEAGDYPVAEAYFRWIGDRWILWDFN